ncbi:hypothetical protein HNR39_000831 [Glaciimonas immobilis]|uniref:Uncharacterized protein n=1 Tax=Glaciimonas immobilis TaxID=728004 RepID=A0A840RQZ1_9BURK|nr:hypothetical protein [Glaciimonas immobilis]
MFAIGRIDKFTLPYWPTLGFTRQHCKTVRAAFVML